MRINSSIARQMIEVLDELQEQLKGRNSSPYPYKEWERKRELVKQRIRKLSDYVEQAASMITTHKPTGRPKNGDLAKRTLIFLFARLMNKSNRDTEHLLEVFFPFFGIRMSYKSVERLYSDPEVQATLHNLFILLLQDEDISGDCAGDGTGYSLNVTKHYRSNPDKRNKDYRYAFRIIDVHTGMYVGMGYSAVSEMQAFHQARDMAERIGVPITKIRLDKYFSSEKVLKLFGPGVDVVVLPKKNSTRLGLHWSRIFRKIMESPVGYLKDYYKRNLSEGGFSSDKMRFGGMIRQRREDRQETALFSIGLLHNLFFVRVMPK
jgi:transposase